MTKTRVPKPSSKATRRQPLRSKKTTTPPGYFASDESMFTHSIISVISDLEWIAGGFSCKDVAREQFIFDSLKTSNQEENTRNFCESNDNIKVEILEDITSPEDDQQITTNKPDDQQTQCPISIIPAKTEPTPQGKKQSTPADEIFSATKPSNNPGKVLNYYSTV